MTKKRKTRKVTSFLCSSTVIGHCLTSIYLYPYIFIYILFTIENTMKLTDYLASFD